MNLAETRRESPGLAYAYGLHPAPMAAVGLCERGLRYSDKALALATHSGDLLKQSLQVAESHGDVYQWAITQVTPRKFAASTTEREAITQAEALLRRIAGETVAFRQQHWP